MASRMPSYLAALPAPIRNDLKRQCGGDWSRVYLDKGEVKIGPSKEVEQAIEESARLAAQPAKQAPAKKLAPPPSAPVEPIPEAASDPVKPVKPVKEMVRVELEPEGDTAKALKRLATKAPAQKPAQKAAQKAAQKPAQKAVATNGAARQTPFTAEPSGARPGATPQPALSYTFGRRVIRVRHDRGLSKVALCKALEQLGVFLHPLELARIENPDKYNPRAVTLDEAYALMKVLEMRMGWALNPGADAHAVGLFQSPDQRQPAKPDVRHPEPTPMQPVPVREVPQVEEPQVEAPVPAVPAAGRESESDAEADLQSAAEADHGSEARGPAEGMEAGEPGPDHEPNDPTELQEVDPLGVTEETPVEVLQELHDLVVQAGETEPPALVQSVGELAGRVPAQRLEDHRPAVWVEPTLERRIGVGGGHKVLLPGTGVVEDHHRLEGNAFQLCTALAGGIPYEYGLEWYDGVTEMIDVDLVLLEGAVRRPTRVEVAAESYGKKYPVLRFYAGDTCVVVGFRKPICMVIAAYYATLLGGSNHDPMRAAGGGGKKKIIGLPRTVHQLRNRLMGFDIGFDPMSVEPQECSFMDSPLGKIQVGDMMSKQQIESTYQRVQRKVQAITNSRMKELSQRTRV